MTFEDSTHTYVHNGEQYTSVTTLVKLFTKQTNWDEVAEKYAQKNGHTAQHWRDVWKANSLRATTKGTRYHKIREDSTEGVDCPVIDGLKHAINLDELTDNTYKELIIYDPLFKVAGQIDLLRIKNGTCYITDYKTSKEISNEPKYVHFDRTTKRKVVPHFLSPISVLVETTFNMYALQLSVYAYMLERRGYKIGTLKIEHIIFNSEDPDDLEPKEIKDIYMPYYKEHAAAILKYDRSV